MDHVLNNNNTDKLRDQTNSNTSCPKCPVTVDRETVQLQNLDLLTLINRVDRRGDRELSPEPVTAVVSRDISLDFAVLQLL